MADVWAEPLPVLSCEDVTLRELLASDARALHGALTRGHAGEFLPAPPDSVAGFEAFIGINRRKRQEGRGGCLGVIPAGGEGPLGLFQLTVVERSPLVVEWGFILAEELWGTGVFVKSASLTLDFLFGPYGADQVQGRCAVENGRATSALRKLGAAPGPVSHETSFFDRPRLGQVWTVSADAWTTRRATTS